MIEDGEVKYPVRGPPSLGMGRKCSIILTALVRIAGFGIGVCGKDGQAVPVADTQPTIRIKQLTVGGTSTS